MKIRIFLFMLLFSVLSFAQEFTLLANVNRMTYAIRTMEVNIGNITVIIDDNGDIVGFYDKILEGVIDYNGMETENMANAGKIKNINDLAITYWEVKDRSDARFGKIKSIGNLQVDYWDSKSGREKVGKVRLIGDIVFDYWKKQGFDLTIQGKMSRVGNVPIDYYSDASEKSNYGYLKNIGDVNFTYWDEYGDSELKVGRLRAVSGNSEVLFVKVF